MCVASVRGKHAMGAAEKPRIRRRGTSTTVETDMYEVGGAEPSPSIKPIVFSELVHLDALPLVGGHWKSHSGRDTLGKALENRSSP